MAGLERAMDQAAPRSLAATTGCRAQWRVASAMFVAPARRSRFNAALRREAITWGEAPRRT